MADDLIPGLEGVVAFETALAEPDQDGGQLRYRGSTRTWSAPFPSATTEEIGEPTPT